MKRLILIAMALGLSACANKPLYNWGHYESDLYAAYKSPDKTVELIKGLEALIAESDKSAQRIPPGICAELGTLYLQAGSSDKAIAMYKRERDAWPESKGLMGALITNIERRQQAHAEVKP